METVRIGVGAMSEEVRALLEGHYAPGMPARVCRVLGAWIGSELVGVLTVSHPTLNDSWRRRAWPGEFEMEKRARARKLNELVRRISRVVVLPRHRGCGIGSALVSAYLRRPLTRYTEAVAAMGKYCRCFERAGMRGVECEPVARDVALARTLRAMRFRPEMLVDDAMVARWMQRADFEAALRRWANASGATRGHLRCAGWEKVIAPAAARAVIVRARVWVVECDRAREVDYQGRPRTSLMTSRME